MIYGVIDLGSNTVRLTVYECEADSFNILFSDKTMAGLAGYVEKKILSKAGIEKACSVLNTYRGIIRNFDISNIFVFATASLRNIENTDEAVEAILKRTGFVVEVISGEEEATLDFIGATHNVSIDNGLLVDIGGGSTELVTYSNRTIKKAISMSIGSLSLYTKHVKDILPIKEERKTIKEVIIENIEQVEIFDGQQHQTICGVGGTVRAALKLNNHIFGLSDSNKIISAKNIKEILNKLCDADTDAWKIILKVCPDRIHTIIPGLLVLNTVSKYFGCETIVVSSYGVREGYLYNKVLKKNKNTQSE
jgi:exopolyphosphatase/guanosine-5'-triphosphate,3'-diphosphate pyrophosphatase